MRNKSLLMVCIAGALAGCQANDESLTDFIRGVENQARRDVAKLQPAEDYVVIGYEPRFYVRLSSFLKKPPSPLNH